MEKKEKRFNFAGFVQAVRKMNSWLAHATVALLFISHEIIPYAPLEKCVEGTLKYCEISLHKDVNM